ncbi:hypothetical protein Tco_1123989 [Tanacetum coccineum]|uniref:Uncharacterized protein n=1 Tax=Tanacetum coccineum TaxID=301880 RepID=A0ABQ5J8R5_9ASTR
MEPKHVEISCESVLPPLSPKQPLFVAQNLEGEGDDTQVDIFYNIHDPLSHYRCQIPELHGNLYAYIKLSGRRGRTRLIVEVNIAINDCESKKRSEAVITLLPILEYVSPFLFIDCGCLSLFLKGSSTELFLVVLGSTDKEGHKEDEIVVRSVKGNHEVDSQLLNFRNDLLKEFCAGVECLKLSPLPYIGLKSDEADDDESHLFNLPPHVLENLVMEFCAGVDYLKFRATCKHCHLAAPLIPWNNGKASKIMQNYSLPSPWLIVFDKHKGIMTLTDPMFGDKYFMKTPQELICDFQIKCSRFGWLLILKPGGSLVFFNPFTNDILELPELPDKHKDTVCFSAPPTSPDCNYGCFFLNYSTSETPLSMLASTL